MTFFDDSREIGELGKFLEFEVCIGREIGADLMN
jgi:hypothetical protein